MFFSRTKKPNRKNAPVGQKTEKNYKMEITTTGSKRLVEDGATDRYAKAQKHAESCVIENLVKRYQLGDKKALMYKQAVYLDTTDLPDNLADAQKAMQKLENIFTSLPKEVRNQYNNSKEEFIADYGSERFKAIFTPKTPKPDFVKTEETATEK